MQAASTHSAPQNAQATLRPMRETDLASCHALSQHLKWPHRLVDWQFHHRVSRSWAVELEEADGTQSVAGSGMLYLAGADYASLGLVIIADALQGRGLGRAMMQQLLRDAGTRSVLLNATEAGRPLYEKLGFVVTDTLSQHQSSSAQASVTLAPGTQIRALRADEAPALLALDRQASGMDRSALLQALLQFAQVAVLEQDGQVKGAAMLREFGRGRVIGPVIASNVEDAKTLIAYWVNQYPGNLLRIDVPGRSGLKPWLQEIGLVCVDDVVSMCRGTPPQAHAQWRTYSIINQALG
ncbi:GNAT family N-acetyltransferase [Herbaspirillum rubrisubalbicans]|uniref:N-acetyltransferase n=1 Tax=Herbaspirillum rubrisubalbicans TaxID=80842 RepID=A0AAD0U4S9_9BURK|nr:GNAT family N-acetyltransferase [Herbaspirillum rubrisubalbicans]ALU88151.1 GNAT family acetyltransferase protein [Herbaspirillum rubrisubalbicans M1]AYR23222.1 N-acetyltransferase [Herbaspirillum rubrisubalbicans]